MTPSPSLVTLSVLALLLVTLSSGYALACVAAPFGRCRRCNGTGQVRRALAAVHTCRRCHGSGRRLRTGRRLYASLRRLHDQGTR